MYCGRKINYRHYYVVIWERTAKPIQNKTITMLILIIIKHSWMKLLSKFVKWFLLVDFFSHLSASSRCFLFRSPAINYTSNNEISKYTCLKINICVSVASAGEKTWWRSLRLKPHAFDVIPDTNTSHFVLEALYTLAYWISLYRKRYK